MDYKALKPEDIFKYAKHDSIIHGWILNFFTKDVFLNSRTGREELGIKVVNHLIESNSFNSFLNKSRNSYLDIIGSHGGLCELKKSEWLSNRLQKIKGLCSYAINYLDYGCGDGFLTKALANTWGIPFSNVIGIESEEYIAVKIPDKDFKITTLQNLDHSNEKYDVITISNVLHHIEKPGFVLSKIRKLLSENGSLVVREHAVSSERESIFVNLMDYMIACVLIGQKEPPTIYAYGSSKAWTDLFMSNGFSLDVNIPDDDRLSFCEFWKLKASMP